MKWIGQHIYDLVARFRDDVYLEDISTGTIASGGNLGLDSNNKIVKASEVGSSVDLTSEVTGTLPVANGGTGATSLTADGVLFGNGTSAISAVDLSANGNIIAGGSTPAAVTGANLAGDGLSAAVGNGTLALNVEASQTQITSIGTIGTGEWEGSVIASAYLDADTAHLSGTQTFTGRKTFSAVITQDGDQSGTPGDGKAIHVDAYDFTDNNTSGSGTAAKYAHVNIERPRLMATNSSVTTSDAATLYIDNPPLASTNQTITRAWSMWIDGGNARFDGSIYSGTTEAMNSSGLLTVANQTGITGVGTISSGTWQGTAIASAYIADDAVTFAKASGVSPKVYGSVIKLIPSDFMDNGDGGNTKFGVAYTDVAGTGYGMRPPNNATELYAFVSIPEGMKATHVDIYDKNDLAIEVFEAQINATTMTSKGTGNCNTTLDITDVNSTATNFLAIEVTTTSTGDRIYGGIVTIAAI